MLRGKVHRFASWGTISRRVYLSSRGDTQGGTIRSFREPRDLKSPGKITMFSWFISPWDAARFLLKSQRDMAFYFLRFAPGQRRRQELPSDRRQAARLVEQSVVASVEPALPAKSMANGGPETVPRKARVVSKPMSVSKAKDKKSIRTGKSRGKMVGQLRHGH
jgi:hypothetical protein